MYSDHIDQISEHALSSEEGLLDLIEFVFATIQQQLATVPQIRVDIASKGIKKSKFLFSKKREGLLYCHDNSAALLNEICEVITRQGYDSQEACAAAIQVFYKIPGLNIVKAGFIAQCLGFNVACIDTHNLTALGMTAEQVTARKTLKPATIARKIAAYVELCQEKGAEHWWDQWCYYVAEQTTNKALATGEIVSEFHIWCIIDPANAPSYEEYAA